MTFLEALNDGILGIRVGKGRAQSFVSSLRDG
jgi:hypothetical protein